METGKVIGNVNCLDLTKATNESIAQVSRVKNVNFVFYTRQTAPLLAKLKIDNLNHSVELPDETTFQHLVGQTVIKPDHFKGLTNPIYPLVIGQMIVDAGVSAEEVEKGLAGLALVGQLVCPESLAGVFQSKAVITGSTDTYPPLDKVEIRSVKIDENYLTGLGDATELAVIGSLTVPDVVPSSLIEQKLSKLYVSDEVFCHAENASVLQSRLINNPYTKIIPAGHKLIEKDLVLDQTSLEYLPSNKLFCTGKVRVATDVEAGQLDKALSNLVCEQLLISPEVLRGVLAAKCDLFETKAIFYEGELWLVEGEDKIRASRFDYLDGNATLVVFGSLTIDADVDAQVVSQRLIKVHNFGSIGCANDAQVSAVKARMGMNEGALDDLSQAEDGEEDHESFGNYNFLAL